MITIKTRGFKLLEILVVLSISLLLSTQVFHKFDTKKQKDLNQAKQILAAIKFELSLHYAKYAYYPEKINYKLPDHFCMTYLSQKHSYSLKLSSPSLMLELSTNDKLI